MTAVMEVNNVSVTARVYTGTAPTWWNGFAIAIKFRRSIRKAKLRCASVEAFGRMVHSLASHPGILSPSRRAISHHLSVAFGGLSGYQRTPHESLTLYAGLRRTGRLSHRGRSPQWVNGLIIQNANAHVEYDDPADLLRHLDEVGMRLGS